MKLPADRAVYAEHSDSQKRMEPGWCPRVFNRTEVQEGSSIACDPLSGVITLDRGVYHITGSSQVTYNDDTVHPLEPGWPTKPIPNGGYCRLRYASDPADSGNEKAIVVGTISSANMLPSVIDTWLDVPDATGIVLEHQVGDLVDGIFLQDDAQNSPWHVFARITLVRVSPSSVEHEPSPLGSVFDAAYAVYLQNPERYRRLYGSYLGVVPRFVPTAQGGAWTAASDPVLAEVLERGVLRFGYADGGPYVYHEENGELAGVDWELGNALAEIIRDQYFHAVPGRGLRAEWVRVDVQAGGDPEAARFDALYRGLRTGRFDVAMSGQANIGTGTGASAHMREVDWTSPTALLFTNILYTGRDDYALSALVGGTRERFVHTVKHWPEVRLMCVRNPGPSTPNARALRDDINAAGGHATLDEDATTDSITRAIAEQAIHFSVGDAVASAWIGRQPGFRGLNLDVAASTRPLQTAQPVAAFTLRAG